MERQGFIEVTLRAFRDDETGQYVAHCEELGVASCGDDLDQAFINIMDAVLLYLHTIEVSGERDRVFSERGITIDWGERDTPRSIQARPDEYVSPHRVPVAV